MTGEKFQKLVDVMKRLRIECPWDQEQTHDSIKAATLEETYELIEAIDEKDFAEMKGELGDVLLHIVFHSQIARETNQFNIDDVIDGITEKLIRRHPHVFGETKVKNNDEIMYNWEKIKLEEGRKSVLDGIPKALPQLHRAFRIQEKASKVGFDWDEKEKVWEKVKEEINEFEQVSTSNNIQKIEEELGDLLFSIVNYTRFIGINPENALRVTNEKFIKRFSFIEKKLAEEGKNITDSNLSEMDKLWEESKKIH
ncbi:nucleoside triphosphate pyrophosphohydrolase mazg [hydrocarbon metagenome]|uniref:Nucleoside triphosphate pyrophosphohydrolase mazg n=1 Tax=hydrocarbon metagenome TaxID=938273 RepID=A0A0W8G123_9ZZZZ